MASAYQRQAWDDALLALVVERPGLSGEALLAAVINEANDALARLRERGAINDPEENDD